MVDRRRDLPGRRPRRHRVGSVSIVLGLWARRASVCGAMTPGDEAYGSAITSRVDTLRPLGASLWRRNERCALETRR
jgi:hypothetical protein